MRAYVVNYWKRQYFFEMLRKEEIEDFLKKIINIFFALKADFFYNSTDYEKLM